MSCAISYMITLSHCQGHTATVGLWQSLYIIPGFSLAPGVTYSNSMKGGTLTQYSQVMCPVNLPNTWTDGCRHCSGSVSIVTQRWHCHIPVALTEIIGQSYTQSLFLHVWVTGGLQLSPVSPVHNNNHRHSLRDESLVCPEVIQHAFCKRPQTHPD